MSNIGENDSITAPDGTKMKLSLFRAREIRLIKDRRRNFIKKLSPQKKADFYYRVYQLIDKHTLTDHLQPIMQIGLSPYTFMQEPVSIGNFQTTYGELFSRFHQALDEAAGDEFDA